jgi:predicted polyphosphate/ATP-dependent NAD kinase
MSKVGLIANPASGKDIRRLVAHGSTFDNEEKVRIVRRVLAGLAALRVREVFFMPDPYGIVARAVEQIQIEIRFTPTSFRIRGEQEDSTLAAREMVEKRSACIISLGGDGTNRAIAKGSARVPILPISTGTNNVFPTMIEGTIAGLAAGLIAKRKIPLKECTYRSTRLEVLVDGKTVDMALVDAAVYDESFVGSRAVWDMKKVRQIFLNRAEPGSLGISSIGGLLHPVSAEAPAGLYLELGGKECTVLAPVAPGIVQRVFIKHQKVMRIRQQFDVQLIPSVLALDGEREIELRKPQRASVRIGPGGPLVVDVEKAMAAAARRNIFSFKFR